MSDCKETIDELERFLDKELPSDKVAAIIEHLKTCGDCQGAYEFHSELQRIISVKATRDEISPQFLGRLRDCLGIDATGNGTVGSTAG